MQPSEPYTPASFEARWQQTWEDTGLYQTGDTRERPKYYCLDFFPYPSGEGLHVGHCRNYVPTDVITRFKRMQGFNVLHPMGWDSFGEPTEHFAITHGVHPRLTTDRNTANYKRQMQLIGTSYDWSREIDSSKPEFYRWTQWIFLRLFAKGLAYKDQNWQWWCPVCATTLSSHEIQGDVCWRGHSGVTKRQIPAWYFRITAYADELIQGLERIDWPEPIKAMQRNWIGRSEGWEIDFLIENQRDRLAVFTTRPDTLYGVTFMVLAPEHPFVQVLTTPEQAETVRAYQDAALFKTEIERTSESAEKTGVFTGSYVLHPLSQKRIPIWVADYVLPAYGTGATMGVPAHDQRDYEFAVRYQLAVEPVIIPDGEAPATGAAFEGTGMVINSAEFSGLDSQRAGEAIGQALQARGLGRQRVNYRMRDWLISRQHYWGTPIPIVHCADCGQVPVPENDLPVLLPPMQDFTPDGSGLSPLARVPEFVQTSCPNCHGSAERETDTMGGFACSSWYFLRFTSPHWHEAPFEPVQLRYWMPVDLYVGGAEHAVLHLLYARFWTMFLADEGLISFREPFMRLVNQGQLHGQDGFRMSKSRGNVITPDEMVADYGADALRLHVMFMAPFEYDVDWNVEGIRGSWRFLNKVWKLLLDTYPQRMSYKTEDPELNAELQRAIRDVTERIQDFRFNTMVSTLMVLVNSLDERWQNGQWKSGDFHQALETLLILLAPAAPYIAEELWHRTGHQGSIHQQPWPSYDAQLVIDESIEIPVQVDGKTRTVLKVKRGADQQEIETLAREDETIQRTIDNRQITRVIYVPGKILNIVTQ